MGSEILEYKDRVNQLQHDDTNQDLRYKHGYKAKDIPKLDIVQCKAMVTRNFEKCKEDGIHISNLRASLLCPIGKARMKVPCRSMNCTHLQCFDAIAFLKIQQQLEGVNVTKDWLCPVCEKPAQFGTLRADALFAQILRKTVSWRTTVQFELDGSWSAVAPKFSDTVDIDLTSPKNIKFVNPVVDLTSDDHISDDIDVQVLCEKLNIHSMTDLQEEGKERPTIQALINKMNAQSFPWMKLLLSLMVTISAILAYDVQQHGSFRSSKTGELMKNVGILAVCEQAWSKITVYSLKAIEWLEVNVPIFKSWVYQNYGPHLKLFWERLFSLCVYLWDSTLFIRSWANTNIPPILKQVNDMLPGYAQMVSNVLDNISSSVFTFASTAFKFTEVYFYGAIEWLHKNVFTGSLSAENLQKFAGNAVNTFQQYTMTTYNWISNSIAAVYAGR